MKLSECNPKQLVWYPGEGQDRLLCRIRFVGKDYVSLQVVAATPKSVLVQGYGIGETITSTPFPLVAATKADAAFTL